MSEMVKAKSRVLDRTEAPRVVLEFKLGAARKMERTVLKMLGELADEARTERLKGQLDHHADETRGHIVEQAFGPPGREPEEKSCATIEAIQKEGNANVKITGERVVGWKPSITRSPSTRR